MNTAITITGIITAFILGCVIVTAIRDTTLAKHKAGTRYPHTDGDVTVLGPEIFANSDGTVICWKGVNYERQPERP